MAVIISKAINNFIFYPALKLTCKVHHLSMRN
jgi:hypothetical protein